MKRCVHFIAALLAVLPAAAETVPVPDGFGVKPGKRLERLIYSERTGETPNGVDRETIEQVCRANKELDATKRMPVFEAGYGKPVRLRSQHFFSADGSRRAVYTEVTAYNCPEVKQNGPCGCTYREFVKHRVDISVWRNGRLQHWQAELEDGTGTLHESDAPPPDSLPPPADSTLTQLLGPVVGERKVAGWACAQRELTLANSTKRTCLSLPDPRLPKLLWGRALASETSTPGAPGGMRLSSELQRLVLDAEADAAVFTPPVGIAYRNARRAPSKEFTP